MRIFFPFLILLLFNNLLDAQSYERRGNESSVLLANIYYGAFVPGGDLKDRFGNSFDIGIGVEYILAKSNIIFGGSGSIIFGTEVKEDVLVNLRNSAGFIVGSGGISDVSLRQRGWQARIYGGKLFGIAPKNKRSGIRVLVGVGFLQHKIRIQDNGGSVTQLFGDYSKGYDRMSNGLSLHQYIGYQLLSKNRLINIHAGFEFTQAFTQNRRSYNWDTMSRDETKRTDLLTGFSVGWALPFYLGEDEETIYY